MVNMGLVDIEKRARLLPGPTFFIASEENEESKLCAQKNFGELVRTRESLS